MKWLETLTSQAVEDLGDRERESLYLRGVSDEQIDLYRLGYVDGHLPDADYPEDFLTWWADNLWQLEDSFLIPLTNTLGHVLGFQFRHVEVGRKGYMDYLASKEEAVLFGLHQAMKSVWASGSITFVEGAFDLFPIQRHLPNVVSTLHAGISISTWRLLRRLVDQVYLGWDSDKPGRDAAYKTVKDDKAASFKFQILKFPRVQFRGNLTKDPNELWCAWGDAQLGVFLEQQLNPFQLDILKNAR